MALHLKIITPKKIVYENEVQSVTVPADDGEITVLPHHTNLFTLLKEGIIKVKYKENEDYFSIGAGYLQTDGKEVIILVSRAYGQDEIDERLINEAMEAAQKLASQAKDEKSRQEALSLMRRAIIDSKLLKKRKKIT
ncbi:MAG: ATP synthase F1 subunit epsilon [Microgenomates group bacterium]